MVFETLEIEILNMSLSWPICAHLSVYLYVLFFMNLTHLPCNNNFRLTSACWVAQWMVVLSTRMAITSGGILVEGMVISMDQKYISSP